MNIKNFSVLEAFELAIAMEEEGIEFYRLAADSVDDTDLKKVFLMLKDMEYQHINIFRKFLTELSIRDGMADADLYLTDPEIGSYFRAFAESAIFPVKGAAAKAISQSNSVVDILRLGMQAEKDSILYYQQLAEHSPYQAAKEGVGKILDEEQKHFRSLYELWRKNAG